MRRSRWVGDISDLASPHLMAPVALANGVVLVAGRSTEWAVPIKGIELLDIIEADFRQVEEDVQELEDNVPESDEHVQASVEEVEEASEDFEEAAAILNKSPRGAAALIRICIQNMMPLMKETGKNLDENISSLVRKGLEVEIQQAMDVLQVVRKNPSQTSAPHSAQTIEESW